MFNKANESKFNEGDMMKTIYTTIMTSLLLAACGQKSGGSSEVKSELSSDESAKPHEKTSGLIQCSFEISQWNDETRKTDFKRESASMEIPTARTLGESLETPTIGNYSAILIIKEMKDGEKFRRYDLMISKPQPTPTSSNVMGATAGELTPTTVPELQIISDSDVSYAVRCSQK